VNDQPINAKNMKEEEPTKKASPRRRKRDEEELWEKWDMRVLDTIIYVVAIAGAVNQMFIVTLTGGKPDTLLIGFCLSLLGVPSLRKVDERRRQNKNDDKE
jgi:hypothetical protein